ncbi:hypothetical protein GIX45_07835 [Erwinia sp. CPCC 100877]|nr:hypothetical protein [Erwinia sp. CPCC 100877]
MNKIYVSIIIYLLSTKLTYAETLQEAIRDGIAHSPTLKYALSQVSVSDSSINQARSGWLPNISISAGKQTTGEDSDEGVNQHYLSLQQTLFDFGRTGDKVDNAKFSKGQQVWEAVDSAEKISARIAEDYFNIIKGRELLKNNKQVLAEHRRILGYASARADNGMDNQSDVHQVQVRIKGLEASAESIEAELQATVREYEILVGHAPGVLQPQDLTPFYEKIEKNLEEQVRSSPQIKALQMEFAATSAQYQYLKKSWLPQLTLSVSHGKTSAYSENGTQVMLNVTSNIFDGGNSLFQAQGVARQIESARWNIEKSIEDNLSEISQQLKESLGFKLQALSFSGRAEQARSVMELYNEQYRVNRRSIIDLLNSAQDYFQAEDNKVNALANQAVMLIRAMSKLGRLNELFNISTNITSDPEIDSRLTRKLYVPVKSSKYDKISFDAYDVSKNVAPLSGIDNVVSNTHSNSRGSTTIVPDSISDSDENHVEDIPDPLLLLR